MKTLFASILILSAGSVFAQATPVGAWKTIDDKTKTEKAIVRITETGGVLSGKIEKLLAPDAKLDAVCDKCEDDRKGKPIVGLEILRSVKKGSEDGVWDGGTILDSTEGKIYKVRMQPIDGGKKMEVRGYVGLPLLGRTQTWIRAE
jgi:uncharacterized protein (DUF2147 family)